MPVAKANTRTTTMTRRRSTNSSAGPPLLPSRGIRMHERLLSLPQLPSRMLLTMLTTGTKRHFPKEPPPKTMTTMPSMTEKRWKRLGRTLPSSSSTTRCTGTASCRTADQHPRRRRRPPLHRLPIALPLNVLQPNALRPILRLLILLLPTPHRRRRLPLHRPPILLLPILLPPTPLLLPTPILEKAPSALSEEQGGSDE